MHMPDFIGLNHRHLVHSAGHPLDRSDHKLAPGLETRCSVDAHHLIHQCSHLAAAVLSSGHVVVLASLQDLVCTGKDAIHSALLEEESARVGSHAVFGAPSLCPAGRAGLYSLQEARVVTPWDRVRESQFL